MVKKILIIFITLLWFFSFHITNASGLSNCYYIHYPKAWSMGSTYWEHMYDEDVKKMDNWKLFTKIENILDDFYKKLEKKYVIEKQISILGKIIPKIDNIVTKYKSQKIKTVLLFLKSRIKSKLINLKIAKCENDHKKIVRLVNAKCGDSKNQINEDDIPSKIWEKKEINECILENKWGDTYLLTVWSMWMPNYNVYIKNWEIEKEWYPICWKWFKNIKEYENLDWKLPVGTVWNNLCTFMDITDKFKYNGYYKGWEFILSLNKLSRLYFYVDDSHKYDQIYSCESKLDNDNVVCKNVYTWKKINVKIKRYNDGSDNGNWFLLYTMDWKLLKLTPWPVGPNAVILFKTFINWKEVK